jgi:hypothetical protein
MMETEDHILFHTRCRPSIIHGTQRSDFDEKGEPRPPLLVPDLFHNDLLSPALGYRPTGGLLRYTPSVARCLYSYLQRTSDARRDRGFVTGAMYKDIYPGYKVLDASVQGDIDLLLSCVVPGGASMQSTVRIFDARQHTSLVQAAVRLGQQATAANARKESGDYGRMLSLGTYDAGTTYVPNKWPGIRAAMTRYSVGVSEFLRHYSPLDLKDIRVNEIRKWRAFRERRRAISETNPLATQTVSPTELQRRSRNKRTKKWLPEMGGTFGAGNNLVISTNLGNSSHYDLDASRSFSLWSEDEPGNATNWYFVMPNCSVDGSSGVLIRLFHGAAISWDGRVIRHCTSVVQKSQTNNVYGAWVGSSRGSAAIPKPNQPRSTTPLGHVQIKARRSPKHIY